MFNMLCYKVLVYFLLPEASENISTERKRGSHQDVLLKESRVFEQLYTKKEGYLKMFVFHTYALE